MNAGAMQRHATVETGSLDGFNARIGSIRVHPAHRCDDVFLRPQNGFDLVVVGNQRRVHYAVRINRQDVILVRGGLNTQGLATEDLTDVAAMLVGAVDPAAGQFEVGMIEHGLDRRLADTTGRPLDHFEGLGVSWVHRPPSYSNPDASASDSLVRSLWRVDSDCQRVGPIARSHAMLSRKSAADQRNTRLPVTYRAEDTLGSVFGDDDDPVDGEFAVKHRRAGFGPGTGGEKRPLIGLGQV